MTMPHKTAPPVGGLLARRGFLAATWLAAGSMLASCAASEQRMTEPSTPRYAGPSASPTAAPTSPAPSPTTTTPEPTPRTQPIVPQRFPTPTSPFTGLPGEGNLLAWTVDDGADSAVVSAYAAFAAATGTRLTLFATGSYPAWRQNADLLRPLVASGQVQIANHTWSHPDLTTLSDHGIRDELQRTHDLVGELFGVTATPFYRPPYGFYDERVLSIAAEMGYTAPAMWYGSLADSGYIPEDEIVRLAHEWFLPQHIVIGHLNHAPVTHVFPQLTQVIADRGLQTVTLNDVFGDYS